MSNMEDYKTKTIELLKQNSLSEEDISFWKDVFSRSEQEDMHQVLKEFQLMSSPQDFKTFTDIKRRTMQAIIDGDMANLNKALEDEKEYVTKKIDEQCQAELGAADKKIKEILNS